MYRTLRAEGALPPMSDEYFARLGFADLDDAPSLSRHVSDRQLGWVRLLGMATFLLVGYARRPWRVLRTLRALVTERSTTVVELRLVEVKRRLVSALRRPAGHVRRGLGPRPANDATVPALTK
jgi:hypothetical protein